jgi:hypothetical protein
MLGFPKIVLGGAVWLLLATGANFAQSFQGSITGTVKDPQGAIVVGAKVTVTEIATNVQHATTTNGSGLYAFPDLLPGTYVVSVSAQGFRELKSSNIVLVAAASNRFDAELTIGDQKSEAIVVKVTAPTLITDSAETGNVVTGEDVVREPMQRSALQLLQLTPATVAGDSSHILIGGQRSQYENLTIDGITTMNNVFGGQSGGLTADQSFESIADVKIIDGNGSAETPGFTSLITTTKGGTNQLHGSAFYTTDNAALNALPFGSTPPGPKGPELQWYGGSVGGPVWLPKLYNGRNKTFFFVTWEHRTFPLAAGNTFFATASLPTVAFSKGDFSSLLLIPASQGGPIQLTDPFTGGNIPGNKFSNSGDPNIKISPVAQALQSNFYPTLPSPSPTGSEFQNDFSTLQNGPEHINREDFRIDHHFSDHDTLSGRFTRQVDPQPTNYDQNTLIFRHLRESLFTNMYVAETHSFSSSVANELRLGYSRDRRLFSPPHDGNAVLKQIGLNLAVPVPAGTRGFPRIGFSDVESMGELGSGTQISQEYSLLDNVSWQKGKHGIKAGILVRYGKPQKSGGNQADQFGSFIFDSSFTGFDYANFLLGLPTTFDQASNFPSVYIRKTDTAWFAQDSWHATSKLTLTLGLRWEYYMPPVDHNGRRVDFDPATGNIVVPSAKTLALFNPTLPTVLVKNAEVAPAGYSGSSLLYGRKANFGPRLGLAYLLDRRTVVRSGYGIYFGQLINAVQDSLANGGLFGTDIGATNTFNAGVPAFQFPSPFAGITTGGGSSCTTACGINITGTNPHIKTPTTQQWSLTVERDLGRSFVARVGYRGFMTTQLPVTRDLTIPPPSPSNSKTLSLFPFYKSVEWTDSGGIQKMNALDLALERRFTGGLTLQAAYTFSRNLSDEGGSGDGEGGSPSNPFNRAADMGNVSLTPRHRMVNNLVWDVPYGRGQRFGSDLPKPMDYVLGGWEISIINVLQSGNFLTPTYSGGQALGGVNQNIRRDNGTALRPDCNGSLSVSNQSRANWFNAAAITPPALGTYGNCGVGIIQGPGLFGFSSGIHKFFKLGEKAKLKFEANMMDALNHPNPANPGTNLNGNFFGSINPQAFNGSTNAFNPGVTTANGERHIWLGLRFEF